MVSTTKKKKVFFNVVRIISVLLLLIVGIAGFLWFESFYTVLMLSGLIYVLYILVSLQTYRVEHSLVLGGREWRSTYCGYEVYSVKKDIVGSSNFFMLKEKKRMCIIAEEELYLALNDEEKKACFLHEIGHLHTIPRKLLFVGEQISIFAGLVGVNLLNFYKIRIVALIALFAFCSFALLKRYIEYKADKYAIKQGASAEALISAVTKAESMNNVKSGMTMSGHPEISRREKRLMIDRNKGV